MITEDKAYRCLVDWKSRIESRDRWIAPITLLASLGLTFVTSTFKDAFGIPKETWEAIFLIGIAVALVWTLKCLWALFRAARNPGVEDLIDQLKKGAIVERKTISEVHTSAEVSVSN